MKHKKGTGDTPIFLIVVAPALAVLFLVFVFIFGSGNPPIEKDRQQIIFTHRFLESPDCFNVDGFIDWDSFDESHLNSCYSSKVDGASQFQLTLKAGDEEQTISTEKWSGRAKARQSHSVKIIKNNQIIEGTLSIKT